VADARAILQKGGKFFPVQVKPFTKKDSIAVPEFIAPLINGEELNLRQFVQNNVTLLTLSFSAYSEVRIRIALLSLVASSGNIPETIS